MNTPSDQKARAEALDPRRSFIVQAPAGSGKTELLTRRFLVLLANTEQPEQIVAITFTRKAAAEMRHRILSALVLAQQSEPEQVYRKELWKLARAALAQDERLGWALLRNPGRLQIQTIDSLCSSLARRLPILSRLGTTPELIEEPNDLLREAARRTIQALEGMPQRPIVAAMSTLYEHLDGDLRSLEELLVAQLRRRDQWMPVILSVGGRAPLRRDMEGALQQLIEDHLQELLRALPDEVATNLPRLGRAAAQNLKRTKSDGAIVRLEQLQSLPGATATDLPSWLHITALLLTKKGELRKQVNVGQGFPPKAPEKPEMTRLLAALENDDAFVQLLSRCRGLPTARYNDAQWKVLEALIVLLKHAVAQLRLVFAEAGKVDFIEIAQAALLALEDEEGPTALALMLDHQICHLLVDEYQDTSFGQLELLQRLIAGWEPDDGRTLFLVGDPMQSIYRFREAEVGLFLRAQKSGVGDLRLEPLTLEQNFRSQEHLVAWVNEVFAEILPRRDDVEVGAVSYSRSTAHGQGTVDPAVVLHPSLENDREAEGEAVAALIAERLTRDETKELRIAVLARARAHLYWIATSLELRDIRFQALDVAPLSSRPCVSDLLALTRALLDAGDGLAWLSILRAPFCGLVLADLLKVANAAEGTTFWSCIAEASIDEVLSPAGRVGIARLRAAMEPALAQRRRLDLRRWVEGVWLALGGPAASGVAALDEAESFFRLLEQQSSGRTLIDIAALQEAVEQLYAPPDAGADGRVQLMTMHKAKGLEFDIVILPGLGLGTKKEDKSLLRATRRSLAKGKSALLLAPIRGAGEEREAIYDHLGRREGDKSRHEASRLLYVACTRAKTELHLFGHAQIRKSARNRCVPASGSLLGQLWCTVEGDFEALDPPDQEATQAIRDGEKTPPAKTMRRLEAGWRPPPLPNAPLLSPPLDRSPLGIDAQPHITFDWASPMAAPVGTVVHRYLERFAATGIARWTHARVAALAPAIEASLRSLGLSGEDLELGKERVLRGLDNVIDDQRAGWILDPEHQGARSEVALTARLDGELVNVIVDRTFLEDGVRWIIDYKTGGHEGGKLEEFLAAERIRYGAQLERYAQVYRLRGDKNIRLALYFPLLSEWVSWDYLAT